MNPFKHHHIIYTIIRSSQRSRKPCHEIMYELNITNTQNWLCDYSNVALLILIWPVWTASKVNSNCLTKCHLAVLKYIPNIHVHTDSELYINMEDKEDTTQNKFNSNVILIFNITYIKNYIKLNSSELMFHLYNVLILLSSSIRSFFFTISNSQDKVRP